MTLTADQTTEACKTIARYKKAKKISSLLIMLGGTKESVIELGKTEMGRTLAANGASTHVPSEVTWELIVAMVEEWSG